MAATTSISLSPPDFISMLHHKPCLFLKPHKQSFSRITSFSSKKTQTFHNPLLKIRKQNNPIWRIYATAGETPPLEATPLETSQQIVSSNGDELTANIISALLIIAFVGLSIVTVGVIYIGVTDFLQKRERDKFEKEEAAKSKKGGKKKKVKARAGPRGFGQKIVEDEDF
ncbi:hypothetical protein CsatB_029881 [Cannabis sativa]